MDFPKIKKAVSKFFLGEEGKITKESLVKLGTLALLSAASVKGDVGRLDPDSWKEYDHSKHNSEGTSEDFKGSITLHADELGEQLLPAGFEWIKKPTGSISITSEDGCFVPCHESAHDKCWDRPPVQKSIGASTDFPAHKNILSLDKAGTAIVATHDHDISYPVTDQDLQITCDPEGYDRSGGKTHANFLWD